MNDIIMTLQRRSEIIDINDIDYLIQICVKFNNITEDMSARTSHNDGRYSSKELISVQIQSDDVDTSTTTYSEESENVELKEVISYKDIDRALATHIKRSIDKIHEISAVLQGITSKISHVIPLKRHA